MRCRWRAARSTRSWATTRRTALCTPQGLAGPEMPGSLGLCGLLAALKQWLPCPFHTALLVDVRRHRDTCALTTQPRRQALRRCRPCPARQAADGCADAPGRARSWAWRRPAPRSWSRQSRAPCSPRPRWWPTPSTRPSWPTAPPWARAPTSSVRPARPAPRREALPIGHAPLPAWRSAAPAQALHCACFKPKRITRRSTRAADAGLLLRAQTSSQSAGDDTAAGPTT